jgi:hypothetical protein
MDALPLPDRTRTRSIMDMSLSRSLRGALAVLLLWPVLSYALLLTLHTSEPRGSMAGGESCCSIACRSECGSCGTAPGGACSTGTGAGADCAWSATPCHTTPPSAHAAFSWNKSTPPLETTLVAPDRAQRVARVEPMAPVTRPLDGLDRPPAA